MLRSLRDATPARCGGKAATLSALLRDGLPVPDGFVVPSDDLAPRGASPHRARGDALRGAVARELERMRDPVVAVRSSAADEDTAGGVGRRAVREHPRGPRRDRRLRCHRRLPRVRANLARRRLSPADRGRGRPRSGDGGARSAARRRRRLRRDVHPRAGGRSDAHRGVLGGLGTTVVGGRVTPDRYEVSPDGSVRSVLGRKETRVDVGSSDLVDRPVGERMRAARALGDDAARSLSALGSRIAALLGGAQDVEWAVAEGRAWILQARPITASVPPSLAAAPVAIGVLLTGAPGSHGVVTARARIVRGPSDFGRVRPGEILICPVTDPAWTPLFALAAGVITETGGTLSHAAIVAREHGIPAALGVDGDRITLDGTAGTVTRA